MKKKDLFNSDILDNSILILLIECIVINSDTSAELKFLLCVDLAKIFLQLRGGCRDGDIDFKAYSMILGVFRGNPLKIRVLRSCSENLVQLR